MKIFVHHDSTGTIRSLVTVNAPEGRRVMLTPRPGELVVEVEGLDLERVEPKPGAPDVAALREIAKRHKVEMSSPRCSLTKTSLSGQTR